MTTEVCAEELKTERVHEPDFQRHRVGALPWRSARDRPQTPPAWRLAAGEAVAWEAPLTSKFRRTEAAREAVGERDIRHDLHRGRVVDGLALRIEGGLPMDDGARRRFHQVTMGGCGETW